MKTSAVLTLAAAKLIAAHTTFQSFVIDGEAQEQHFGVQTPSNDNNPILDVTDSAMICNGGTAKDEWVEVSAGSTIGMQWHHNDPATLEGDQDEPIAASHKGPVMVYMAPAEGNGEGAVWTKIWEDGLEGGEWAVDRFISNAGLVEITLPDLADGDYLIRPEMIGLHEGNREGGAQFYNGCGQLRVSGGSASLPSSGVDMTQAYSAQDPGVLYDMYAGSDEYTIPGPAVWDGSSSGGSGSTPTTPTTPSTPSSPASSAPAAPSAPASSSAPAPTPSTSYGEESGSGSSFPSSFTAAELISLIETQARDEAHPNRFAPFVRWLQQQSGASSKVRRHARDFA